MDQNVNEKIESLRTRTREFMQHERASLSEYGGGMLKEVETLVVEAVESASAKIDSILGRVSESVRKEPFVAMAAFAITGLAVYNLISKRRKSPAPSSGNGPAPDIKH
jgi:hypothetical protein